VLTAGGTDRSQEGTGWCPLHFVYQPFTIETLIFIQSLDGMGKRFLAVSHCALICRQLSSIPQFGQRKSH
jgi:hypothetical protein